MEPFSGQPSPGALCHVCQEAITCGEEIVAHSGGTSPCGKIIHAICFNNWAESQQNNGHAVNCLICTKQVIEPPPNWNQLQEELDYNLVFHEEAQPLTDSTIPYLRVPEPLKAHLQEMVNEYGQGSLKMHAILEMEGAIKDITILRVRQNMGNLEWEFEMDRENPDGFIEADADIAGDLDDDDLGEEEEEGQEEEDQQEEEEPMDIEQEQENSNDEEEDLPERGWVSFEPDNITQWHDSLRSRLQELWEEHGDDSYHGRGIQMRTHMEGFPRKVIRVEVGVERSAGNQEFPVWYHQWEFEFEHGSSTWAVQERDVRVRVPGDD